MFEYLMIIFTALFADNLVFSRLLGTDALFDPDENKGSAGKIEWRVSAVACASVTAIAAVSCAAAGLFHKFIFAPLGLEYLRTFLLVALMLAVSLLWDLVRKRFPMPFAGESGRLPLLSSGCAVLGAMLISWERGYGFIEGFIFGLFASLGYILAILFYCAVRERLERSRPPECFAGPGIGLIAAGLAAMAFAGLAGIRFA